MASEHKKRCSMVGCDGSALPDSELCQGHQADMVTHQYLAQAYQEREELRQQLAQATDLLRRFYYAFRRDVYTNAQADACNEAEDVLRIPSHERDI